ncbi:MAG: nucleotidyltransferase family protein [Nocardioides sp.]
MSDVATDLARLLTGPVGRRVVAHRTEVLDILVRHGATNPRLFGSVARGEDRSDSDVDLLVDFSPGIGLFDIFRIQDELQAILDAEVDLVAPTDLKAAARARIESELLTL